MACTPDIQIEKVHLKTHLQNHEVFIVREDLLDGGTKERGAIPYISNLKERGFSEFVYASPFSGFAQVALSIACKKQSVGCKVFAVRDPARSGLHPHAYTALAEQQGASITLTEQLATAEELATTYASEKPKERFKIPLGFDDPIFREHLKSSLQIQWQKIHKELQHCPSNVWVSLGSGTLAGILRTIVPEDVHIHVMDVHALPHTDPRVQKVSDLPNVHYHSATLEFAEPETLLPPIPSNLYYDAKVWKTFASNAKPGDVWWNVAR